jgi:sigma-B regulation protein RsbU (phosphoserine phosphatase)
MSSFTNTPVSTATDRNGSGPRPLDPRGLPIYALYQRFRNVLASAARSSDPCKVACDVLSALLEGSDSGPSPVLSGRVFRRRGNRLVLVKECGDSTASRELSIATAHPAVQQALRSGWALFDRETTAPQEEIERVFGPPPVALIVLGSRRPALLSLSLRETAEDLPFAMATLQSIAETARSRRELGELFEQAVHVQTSLLPAVATVPEGFDIAFKMRPAEIVGGDWYDIAHLRPNTFAIIIGDATGHGLPAALHARDAIVGVRMGLEQELKALATVEKLDRILARSNHSKRFVSLFYAEVDARGHMIYLNAGHVPPFIVGHRSGRVRSLDATGPVLGVNLHGRGTFDRAFERLDCGDVLVLYTDGVTETVDDGDVEYGRDRLVHFLSSLEGATAEETVVEVFRDLDRYAGGSAQVDDQSLLVLRRS